MVHPVTAAEVTIALPAKSFQQIIFPLAQERGYMKEEGIDLKITFMEPTPSIQALVADSIQVTGSGGSALIAIARGNVPMKVVLAVNDRVHQWILSRPNIASIKDLKGKKIATTGVASISTFMFKNLLPKHGLDGNKDVFFVDPGVGNQAVALMSGAVDAAIVSVEQRYAGVDNGMKELMYLGQRSEKLLGYHRGFGEIHEGSAQGHGRVHARDVESLAADQTGSRWHDRGVYQVFRLAPGDRDAIV